MKTFLIISLALAFALTTYPDLNSAQAAPGDEAQKRRVEKRKAAKRKAAKRKRNRERRAERSSEEEDMVFDPDPEPELDPESEPRPDYPSASEESNEAAQVMDREPVLDEAPAKKKHASLLDEKNTRTRFYARAGVLHMQPNVSSGNVRLSNLSEFAELAIDPGPIPNSGADVAPVTVPIVTVGYVLPWMDGQLSVETLLGLPIELELEATGAMATESLAPFALGNVPTGVPAIGTQLGSAKALPPIVTAVYRFLPAHKIHPYVGAGLSYMHIFDAKVTNPILVEVAEPNLEVEDAFGVVAQVGFEVNIYDRYYAMFDLKTILGLNMSAKVTDIYIRTPELPVFEMANAGDASVDISLLPLIGAMAVGADF